MPKLIPQLSEGEQKFIRDMSGIIPVSQMAERFKVSYATVRNFVRREGLPMKERKPMAKITGARHCVQRRIPVKDGLFNVHQYETWLV